MSQLLTTWKLPVDGVNDLDLLCRFLAFPFRFGAQVLLPFAR